MQVLSSSMEPRSTTPETTGASLTGSRKKDWIGGDGAAIAISDVVSESDITVEVQRWLEGPSAIVVVDNFAFDLQDLEVDGIEGVTIGIRRTSEEIALANGVGGVFVVIKQSGWFRS